VPSHASLFTGRDVVAHQVERRDSVLSDRIPMLAELLHAEGYHSGMLTYNPLIGPASGVGLSCGFDEATWTLTLDRRRPATGSA
jgi:arylsulfatase A-like enzyme